ncbi:DUF3108 domain-containing protein [Azohydromonas aeria]|uniref:DUF3108 domain-containing protein n=1 Tax=Azohydromonas aeria TaxID=2590212 RepID=UPI0012F95CEB|nr:DUF3108 domain-containing protein [Azohydromonas aeria]
MPAPEVPPTRRPRRRLRLALLVLGVALAHAWLIDDVALSLPRPDAPPPRLEVAFVRELAPTAAPPPPPAAAPPRHRPEPVARPAPKPAAEPASAPPEAQAAASAPLDAASAPADEQLAAADAASTPAWAPGEGEGASAVAQAASAPPPAEAAASAMPLPEQAAAVADARGATGAQPDWPPATQLDFELTGWYRGDVHGSARVQWLRQDRRYQVHLDVTIGPSFAPLMSRRMSSDGEVTPRGLAPKRYDEVTKFGFSSRQATVLFEPDVIVLGNGTRRVAELGVQDTASQFVQMTWMFTMQPELLTPGGTVALPLALPRRMDTWTYDVLGEEVLDTPLGRIPAVHLRPRIPPKGNGEVMTVEAWFAPTLQYLPVRLLIRQSAEVWADLKLKRLPLQAR